MLVLGIESATAQVGVAIGGHEGVLASAHSSRDRRHAESLAPQIRFVCQQARIRMSEIGVVAVDVGPGLFTGLRVGVASAMAVAHGLDVPMIGVSSLDLGAFAVQHTQRRIVVCFDARRGEVFHATYEPVPGGVQRVGEPAVSTPADLASDIEIADTEVLLVGDGGVRYEDVFAQVRHLEFAGPAFAHPSARALVDLAHPRALREEFVRPHEIEPLYLRLPDAEINWSTRDG